MLLLHKSPLSTHDELSSASHFDSMSCNTPLSLTQLSPCTRYSDLLPRGRAVTLGSSPASSFLRQNTQLRLRNTATLPLFVSAALSLLQALSSPAALELRSTTPSTSSSGEPLFQEAPSTPPMHTTHLFTF